MCIWDELSLLSEDRSHTALVFTEGQLSVTQQTRTNISNQAAKTQENLQSSIQNVARLQGELSAASEKYTYLQELKGYIADLCDMLQARRRVVFANILSVRSSPCRLRKHSLTSMCCVWLREIELKAPDQKDVKFSSRPLRTASKDRLLCI